MPSFQAALSHPVFAAWFRRVHPLFWLILYWHLGRIHRQMMDGNFQNVLVAIHWWGAIRIVRTGQTVPDPSAYRAYVPAKPCWDDPVWASDVPANVETFFLSRANTAALFLPRAAGGGGSRLWRESEGALPSLPDTS